MDVVVVGAGVVGLTCAVRLLEAGHRVAVVAKDLPLQTTSALAAAICYPYLAAPADLVARWCAVSEQVYARLSRDAPAAGVRLLPGHEAGVGERVLPVIDMSVYLPWLADTVRDLGGEVVRATLSGMPGGGSIVVNCSGLAARDLVGDRSLDPVQGQVVLLEQWGLARWALDDTGDRPTYVVPRLETVVVGGTEVAGEWLTSPDPDVAQDILRRAAVLVPEVATARVLHHRVGLRPSRPTVRVERVGDVVHCYGHGGSGVTLAWGTAADVVGLVGPVGTAGRGEDRPRRPGQKTGPEDRPRRPVE